MAASRRVAQPEVHKQVQLAAVSIRLGSKLDLSFEHVEREVTLPHAGRVDIRAQQAGTGATVVIENQLGDSDDSHCLRLLGYAATAEASILVWVARSFSSYHRSILEWLNEADTIHVYAVTVHAYRVGDAVAADFETVVEPPQSQAAAPRPVRRTASTLYAEFYRPLVARLRQQREDIDGKVEGTVFWEEGRGASLVMLKADEEFDLTGAEEEMETVRRWMADNLLPLRDAVQPHLDRLMGVEAAEHGEGAAGD